MTKAELLEALKAKGLKGNIKEKKEVLEARLARDHEQDELVEEIVWEDKPRVVVGFHPITREKVYK